MLDETAKTSSGHGRMAEELSALSDNRIKFTSDETIKIGGRDYRKFWPTNFANPVDDGTVRCIFCGQIDEDGYHDNDKCCACPEWDGVDRQQGVGAGV